MTAMTVLLITAATATSAMMPLILRTLNRLEMTDRPNERSSHDTPTPRGGGIACAFGVVAATSIAATQVGLSKTTWIAIIVCLAMAMIGLADDRHQLSPIPRLLTQVILGALLGATIGGLAWLALGAVIMPLIVNTVNFMDGVNGMTASTMAIWGGVTALAGTSLNSYALVLLGASTAGAAVGFLPWNAPRARVFLGDVGSYLFGALAAVGIMLAITTDSSVSPMLIAVLLPYLVDVLTTVARRALQGESLLTAHREHTYQQIQFITKSHAIPTAIVSIISLLTAATWALAPVKTAIVLSIIFVTLYILAPWVLSKLHITST